jgi:hypothetical protein
LRPSPFTHRRRLPLSGDSQLSLPLLTESEVSEPTAGLDRAIKAEIDHGLRSDVRRLRRKSFSPPAEATKKTNAPDRRPVRKAAKPKPPNKASIPPEMKILVSRDQAAEMLSISIRGVDYYIATKRLSTRRKGTRVLIPVEDIRKFARSDHPERMAG